MEQKTKTFELHTKIAMSGNKSWRTFWTFSKAGEIISVRFSEDIKKAVPEKSGLLTALISDLNLNKQGTTIYVNDYVSFAPQIFEKYRAKDMSERLEELI